MQQDADRVSCQVTVVVVVTDIDVSPTGSRNFNGDLTVGTLFPFSFFVDVWQPLSLVPRLTP